MKSLRMLGAALFCAGPVLAPNNAAAEPPTPGAAGRGSATPRAPHERCESGRAVSRPRAEGATEPERGGLSRSTEGHGRR